MAITWFSVKVSSMSQHTQTFTEEGLASSSSISTERSYMLNSHLEPQEPKDRHVASTS